MTWWLRAHRAPVVALTAVAVGMVTWASASGHLFTGAIRSPIRFGAAVPVPLVLPLAVVAVFLWAIAPDEHPGPHVTASRHNGRWLAGFSVGTVAVTSVALGPAGVVDVAVTASVDRNVVGLLGVALVVRRRFDGAVASAVLALYLVTAALLGSTPDGGASWWAWPVAVQLEPVGLVVAATSFGAGLLCLQQR